MQIAYFSHLFCFSFSISPAPSFSGFRLHFGHVGRRRATTVDMDTRFATQFKFSFLPTTGHCQLKTSFSNIYVQYSADGGFTFFNLQTISKWTIIRHYYSTQIFWAEKDLPQLYSHLQVCSWLVLSIPCAALAASLMLVLCVNRACVGCEEVCICCGSDDKENNCPIYTWPPI